MPSSHRRRPKACRLAYDTQKARRLSPLLFTSHLRDQAFIRDVAWIVASKRDGLIHTGGHAFCAELRRPCCLGGVDRVRDGVMARSRAAETRQEV